MTSIRFLAMAAVLTLTAPWARADEPYPAPLKPPLKPAAVQSWGESHAECAEWTNACTVCKRSEAGAVACSTPGIACQPKAVSCSAPVKRP